MVKIRKIEIYYSKLLRPVTNNKLVVEIYGKFHLGYRGDWFILLNKQNYVLGWKGREGGRGRGKGGREGGWVGKVCV